MFWSIRELEVSGRLDLLSSFIHKALRSPWVRPERPPVMAVVQFHISSAHFLPQKRQQCWSLWRSALRILRGYADWRALQKKPLGFEKRPRCRSRRWPDFFTFITSRGRAVRTGAVAALQSSRHHTQRRSWVPSVTSNQLISENRSGPVSI